MRSKVSVIESSRPLRNREIAYATAGGRALQLYNLAKEGFISIDVDYYLKAKVISADGSKEFISIYIVGNGGEVYITGSESFYDNLKEVVGDLEEDRQEGESILIDVSIASSKKNAGRYYLTCYPSYYN